MRKKQWIAYLTIRSKKYYDYASIRNLKSDVQKYIDSVDAYDEAGYKIEKVFVTITKLK